MIENFSIKLSLVDEASSKLLKIKSLARDLQDIKVKVSLPDISSNKLSLSLNDNVTPEITKISGKLKKLDNSIIAVKLVINNDFLKSLPKQQSIKLGLSLDKGGLNALNALKQNNIKIPVIVTAPNLNSLKGLISKSPPIKIPIDLDISSLNATSKLKVPVIYAPLRIASSDFNNSIVTSISKASHLIKRGFSAIGKIRLSVVDNASLVISNIQEKLQLLSSSKKNIPIGLKLRDNSSLFSNLKLDFAITDKFANVFSKIKSGATHAAHSFANSFSSSFSKIGQGVEQLEAKFNKLSTSITATEQLNNLAQGFVSAFSSPIATASRFQQSLSGVSAVSLMGFKNSGTQAGLQEYQSALQQLEESAISLGQKTSWSASAIADGMAFLGMAGFKWGDIIKSMPGVASLASAGGTSLSTAADIASNVGNTFFGEAASSQMGRLGDVMAHIMSGYNVDLVMLGETMKYAAPVAAKVGTSFETLAVASGILGNSGIQASQAGTTLRQILSRLASPPAAAAKALKQLGVSTFEVVDGKKNLRDLPDILTDIAKASDGLGTATKAGLFAKIAGMTALSGFNVLVDEAKSLKGVDGGSTSSFHKRVDTVGLQGKNVGGTADNIASERLNNLSGDFTILKSNLESVAISFANIIEGPLRSFVQMLTGIAQSVNSFINNNQQLIGSLYGVGASIAAVFAGVSALTVTMVGLKSITAGLSFVGSAFVGMLIPIAAIGSAILFVKQNLDALQGFANGFVSGFSSQFQSLSNIGGGFVEVIKNIAAYLKDAFDFDFNVAAFTDFGVVFGSFVGSGLNTFIESLSSIKQSLLDFGSLSLDLSSKIGGLFDSGVAIINTLAQGVLSGANSLWNAMLSVFQKVRSLLPFSDAQAGPFSTLTSSGRSIITTLVDGVLSASGNLLSAISNVFTPVIAYVKSFGSQFGINPVAFTGISLVVGVLLLKFKFLRTIAIGVTSAFIKTGSSGGSVFLMLLGILSNLTTLFLNLVTMGKGLFSVFSSKLGVFVSLSAGILLATNNAASFNSSLSSIANSVPVFSQLQGGLRFIAETLLTVGSLFTRFSGIAVFIQLARGVIAFRTELGSLTASLNTWWSSLSQSSQIAIAAVGGLIALFAVATFASPFKVLAGIVLTVVGNLDLIKSHLSGVIEGFNSLSTVAKAALLVGIGGAAALAIAKLRSHLRASNLAKDCMKSSFAKCLNPNKKDLIQNFKKGGNIFGAVNCSGLGGCLAKSRALNQSLRYSSGGSFASMSKGAHSFGGALTSTTGKANNLKRSLSGTAGTSFFSKIKFGLAGLGGAFAKAGGLLRAAFIGIGSILGGIPGMILLVVTALMQIPGATEVVKKGFTLMVEGFKSAFSFLKEQVLSFITWIKDIGSSIGSKIKGLFSSQASVSSQSAFPSTASPVSSGITSPVSAGLTQTVDVSLKLDKASFLADLNPLISNVSQFINDKFAQSFLSLSDSASSFGNILQQAVSNAINDITLKFIGLQTSFQGFGNHINTQLTQSFGQLISSLSTQLNSLNVMLTAVFSNIGNIIANAFNQVPAIFANIISQISANIASLGQSFQLVFSGLSSNLTMSLQGIVATISNITMSIAGISSGIASSFSMIGQVIAVSLSSAVASFQSMFASMAVSLQTLNTSLSSAFSQIPVLLISAITPLSGMVLNVVNSISNNFTQLSSKISVGMSSMMGTVTGIISNLSLVTISILSPLPARISSIFISMKPTIAAQFQGVPQLIASKFQGLGGILSAIMSNSLAAVVATIHSFGASMQSAGSKLITTFAQGVASKMAVVKSQISAQLQSVRSLLPSSDAREGPLSDLTYSGGKFVETFGKGFDKSFPAFRQSVSGHLSLLNLSPQEAFAIPDIQNNSLSHNHMPSLGNSNVLVEHAGNRNHIGSNDDSRGDLTNESNSGTVNHNTFNINISMPSSNDGVDIDDLVEQLKVAIGEQFHESDLLMDINS